MKQRKTIIVLAIAAILLLPYTAAKTWASDSGDASETVAGKAREFIAGVYPFLRPPQEHRLHYQVPTFVLMERFIKKWMTEAYG